MVAATNIEPMHEYRQKIEFQAQPASQLEGHDNFLALLQWQEGDHLWKQNSN